MTLWTSAQDTLRTLRAQADVLTRQLRRAEEEVRRAWVAQQREIEATAEKLGLPSKGSPVIDVGGGGPSTLRRAARVGVAAAAAVIAMSAFVSLSVFSLQLLCLLLLLTRGLGLRLDVNPVMNPMAA